MKVQEPLQKCPTIDLRNIPAETTGPPAADDKKRGQSGHAWKKK
jgi:hypothetical protein